MTAMPKVRPIVVIVLVAAAEAGIDDRAAAEEDQDEGADDLGGELLLDGGVGHAVCSPRQRRPPRTPATAL